MKRWQRLVDRWTELVFRERYSEFNPKTRVLRLLEEVMELAQAENVTVEEAEIIKKQVWGRPTGEPNQELGGVMVCAAGYAAAAGLDLSKAFWSEMERIMDPVIMEKVRHRNLEGDKIGFSKTLPEGSGG